MFNFRFRRAPKALSVQSIQEPQVVAQEVIPDAHRSGDRFRYLQSLSGNPAAADTLDLQEERARFWASVQANIEQDAHGHNTPRAQRLTDRELRTWQGFWGYDNPLRPQGEADEPLPSGRPSRLQKNNRG